MKSHPVAPLVFLVAFSAALIWQTGKDEQRPARSGNVAPVAKTLPEATRLARQTEGRVDRVAMVTETAPWAHPEVMHELKMLGVEDDWRPAIAHAQRALADDQDVQIEVGHLLISRGNPVDGLAWQLLSCEHCTQADERLGFGCAAKGLCDPHLELVDIFRRDYGEQMTSEALARVEEIRVALVSGESLASFTEVAR